MSKITVIDSACGTGKTSYAIQLMNDTSVDKQNFIFITPFLDEIERVKQSCKSRQFFEPNNKNKKGTKLEGLKNLLSNNMNIATTHALLKNIDKEVIQLLKNNSYILILDEVMQVIENITITTDDFNMLLNNNIIKVCYDGKIEWLNKEYEGKFSDLKRYSLNNNLFLHSRSDDTGQLTLLVWCFPSEIFKLFEKSYILTYLFDGQLQRYYYDMYNIKYEKKSVIKTKNAFGITKYVLGDYIPYWEEDHEELKKLIDIYDGKLNRIGDLPFTLSKSWYDKEAKSKQLDNLKNNAKNYFMNYNKAKSGEVLYTTFKKNNGKEYFKVNGYSSSFLSCNARATNEYADRQYLAYLINRFVPPMDLAFFEDKGIETNQKLWALSELIQWIWRSRIRKGESINIYIPSKRMRRLLFDYINNIRL